MKYKYCLQSSILFKKNKQTKPIGSFIPMQLHDISGRLKENNLQEFDYFSLKLEICHFTPQGALILESSSSCLFSFDGFEEGFKISGTK